MIIHYYLLISSLLSRFKFYLYLYRDHPWESIAQSKDEGQHVLSSSRPRQPHGQHQKASEAASASAPPRANQGEGGSVDFVLPDCGLRCAADGHVYSAPLHAPLG